MDIEVLYAHHQDSKGQSQAGFGVEFNWDTPLLEGYPYKWLRNRALHPNVNSFFGCDTPEVFELLKRKKYDAFLIFGWNRKSSIQMMFACRRNKVPVLVRGDSQLLRSHWRLKSIVKYLPYHWFLPRLSGHLYVGQRNKEYLKYYGVPEKKLFFSPHCVDNAFFSEFSQSAIKEAKHLEIRNQFGIPLDAFVFLFVGKLIPVKAPHHFVEACLQAFSRPESRNVHAVIIGDGPMRRKLESLSEPIRPRVHFAGFRNQSQIPEFYAAGDSLVLPGRESWGLVVNEAMACGIPAVVSDAVGCAPDLIEEGRTGYSFPSANTEALADRMIALKKDCRQKGSIIRKALAKKIACYSMHQATEGLEDALESVAVRK